MIITNHNPNLVNHTYSSNLSSFIRCNSRKPARPHFTKRPFGEVGKGKGRVLPYSLPSVGPGADSGVQAAGDLKPYIHTYILLFILSYLYSAYKFKIVTMSFGRQTSKFSEIV